MSCQAKSASGNGADGEVEETDDEENSNLTPLSATESDIVGHQSDQLADFRTSWQREIHQRHQTRRDPNSSRSESPAASQHVGAEVKDEKYEKAEALFRLGIQHEQDGKMPEAVRFYRLALQLVPDVERRLYNSRKPPSGRGSYGSEEGKAADPGVKGSSPVDLSMDELIDQFSRRINIGGQDVYCRPERNQTDLHLGCLPMEVLLYIFRWAISSEVDMRVLEQISMVCSGFFILARDPGLWHLACLRTWGFRTGPVDANFPSWREMFLNRPRVNFNGVYISKISYVRHGETSYQDQFYRPYHLVIYYRLIRFFADGTMLMFTSSEDPSTCVSAVSLKKPKISGVLVGVYSLVGRDEISALLKRHRKVPLDQAAAHYYSRRRTGVVHTEQDVTFCIELKINTYKRKRNNQLTWLNYEINSKQRGAAEVISRFDMTTDQSLTPFYFSRVRSFTAASNQPLE